MSHDIYQMNTFVELLIFEAISYKLIFVSVATYIQGTITRFEYMRARTLF